MAYPCEIIEDIAKAKVHFLDVFLLFSLDMGLRLCNTWILSWWLVAWLATEWLICIPIWGIGRIAKTWPCPWSASSHTTKRGLVWGTPPVATNPYDQDANDEFISISPWLALEMNDLSLNAWKIFALLIKKIKRKTGKREPRKNDNLFRLSQ